MSTPSSEDLETLSPDRRARAPYAFICEEPSSVSLVSWTVDAEVLRGAERDDAPGADALPWWDMAPEPVAGHRYTEQEIQASLRQTFSNHSALSQVRFDPWASTQSGRIRRVDLLAVENDCDVENRRHVIAYEIKCSRSDFRTDVRDPGKQADWRDMSSRHYFVAPNGIIRPEELPEGSGLVELSRWRQPGKFVGNRVAIVRESPDKGRVPLPGWLVQELLYRVSRHERVAELTSRSIEVSSEQAIAMEKLEHKIQQLRTQVAWLRKQVGTWRRIGAQLGAACKQCGAALEVVHEGVITHTYTGKGFDHPAEV